MFDEDRQTCRVSAPVPLGKPVVPGYASRPLRRADGCVCSKTFVKRSKHRDGCVQDSGLRGLAVLHLHSAAVPESVRGSLHYLRPRGTSQLFLSLASS
jgi:hypothetical protein